MPHLQDLLVLMAVGVATVYLLRRLVFAVRGTKSGAACDDCAGADGCHPDPASRPLVTLQYERPPATRSQGR